MNFLTLGTSFLLGALDGVSPGHGKSLIAAFMVGEKLSLRQIGAMGISLLASHFLLLVLLSAGLEYLFGGSPALHFLEWVGPFAVIGFGVYMLFRHRRMTKLAETSLKASHSSFAFEQVHPPGCHCGHHHQIPFSRLSGKKNLESNSDNKHVGEHDHSQKNIRQVTIFGFLLGLIPCPMAISTILLSMSSDQFSTALMVISTYILGMALVLFVIAGLIYAGRHFLAEKLDRLHYHVDVRFLSALMVICIGVAYLLMNTFHLHVHAA